MSYVYLSIYHRSKKEEGAMSLVKMYQEKLGVSKREAGDRAIVFTGIALASVALAVLLLITFPYQETRTEKIQLIPGNHTWVRELPIHEFSPVAVTYERDFLNLAGEEKILVSRDGSYVTYEVITVGKPFQYRKYRDPSLFLLGYRGGIESAEIYDGVLTLTLHRDWFTVKGFGGLFVFFAVLLVFIIPRCRLPRAKIQPC